VLFLAVLSRTHYIIELLFIAVMDLMEFVVCRSIVITVNRGVLVQQMEKPSTLERKMK
jgi:hypothetical protein